MKYSGQLCQNLKGAASYCSGRWVSATARYEVSITNATSSWEQRESYCVLGRAGLLGVVTAKAGCWMRELVVWHVSLSPSKRSVHPMPVICRFISGFVYLMYNASIISNRVKSFSCLIILVLLTICSLFNVLLWKSWLCLSGAPDWRCIVSPISRRITMHLQSGAPLKHSQDFHNSTLTLELPHAWKY